MKYQHTLTSVASVLPPLTFAPVPGTRMDQLVPSFGPQYKERGFTGTAGIFRAWTSCARRGEELVYLHPGGHNDTNFNGDISYNAWTHAWSLLNPPGDYSDAVWEASRQLYLAAGINPDPLNISRPYAPGTDLVWKDLRPCSTHSWGLVVDAEEFGIFHLRNGIWRYDPTTRQKTKLTGPGSFMVPSDSYGFYSRARKKLYLCADDSANNVYGRIWEVDPSTGVVSITGLTVKQWATGDACELEGGGKAYYYSVYWNLAYLVDFDAQIVTSKPPLSFGADPLVALIHSNKTGLLAIRASATLATVDIQTGTISNVGPSGIHASLLAVSATHNGTWGACKLMTKGTAQKFVIPIETNTDVYEMAI